MLLYSQEGSTRVRIDASVGESGQLTISGHDMGDAPEQIFGADDYEYLVSIAPGDVARLRQALVEHVSGQSGEVSANASTLELVAAAFKGRHDAVSTCRDLCRDHGIAYEFFCWP